MKTKQLESAPEATTTEPGTDAFSDLRAAAAAASADLTDLQQQERHAVSQLPGASENTRRRMELVTEIKELRDQLIPVARAGLEFAQSELQTAELRSTIEERAAVLDEASAALAVLEQESRQVREGQLTSLDPDTLLALRQRADALRIHLPAARLRAKRAERDLLEARRPSLGTNVRVRRAAMEEIDAQVSALKARRLALMSEGTRANDALRDHGARVAKLDVEIDELVLELRSEGRPKGLLPRPTLAMHGNG